MSAAKMSHPSVYLDNAATTPLCDEAREAWLEACAHFGNPSSLHAAGRHARERLNAARKTVADALFVKPERLLFTSGGTESINLALHSAASRAGRKRHIVTTTLEHPAVRASLSALRADGFRVTEVPPERSGTVSPDALLSAVTEETCLVSCVQVASETGGLQDVEALGQMLKSHFPETLLHIDAVQGFLKCPFPPRHADYISISAHKVHAPMGIGALYISEKAPFRPLFYGGGQEGGRRGGTEPWALACAFAAAVSAWQPVHPDLLSYALSRLAGMDTMPVPGYGAPHIVAAAFDSYPGEVLVRRLSDQGVFAGSGSACHSGKKSAALLSMPWIPAKLREGVLRLSFSRFTTMEELSYALDVLEGITRVK